MPTDRRGLGHIADRPRVRPALARPACSALLDRPPRPPSTTRPRGAPLLLLLGILTAIASLSIDMYLPALPAIAVDLHAAPGLLEATLAAFFAGFALGQLAYGPLSDRIGRRPPLIGGLALYTVASIVCATAATPGVLIAGRAAQALGGAAALVIARAVVRDLYDAQDAARVFSRLILIMGLAPVLAPSLGSLLLVRFSWRAVFWLLAAFGAACMVATMRRLPETSPRTATGGLATVAGGYLRIFRDLRFVGLALGGGFAAAGMFAYIAASPFVFIEQLGLSPRQFAIVFGCNAFALIGNSQLESLPAAAIDAGADPRPAALRDGRLGDRHRGAGLDRRDVVAAARRRPVRLRRHHRRGRPQHHRGGAGPLRRGRRVGVGAARRRCSSAWRRWPASPSARGTTAPRGRSAPSSSSAASPRGSAARWRRRSSVPFRRSLTARICHRAGRRGTMRR